MDQKMREAQRIMNEMQKISMRLAQVQDLNVAHTTLWEVAQRGGNGTEEANQRQILHNLLDQGLDIRAEAVQLIKTFQML